MRRWILAALLVLVLAAPARAVIIDQEPANDAIATAPISFVKTGPVTTSGGKLTLVAGDIDFLGIAALSAGDAVVVSVTPLDDPPNLEDPDTMVGLFDSTTVILCRNDDAFNNSQGDFPPGKGSLCRFWITAAGDYYVGVTGYSVTPFDGAHGEDGAYELTISVYAGPTPTPTPTPTATPIATPTPTPTATPTPEPGAMLQLVAGGVGLAFLNKRRLRKKRRARPMDNTDRSPGGTVS